MTLAITYTHNRINLPPLFNSDSILGGIHSLLY